MRVAYITWNPFQLLQFKNIINSIENSTVFILDKGDNLGLFTDEVLSQVNAKIEYLNQNKTPLLDGLFDYIMFQSPFPRMEELKSSCLVSLQYGLAKERHNYGEWRSLADFNLMYGDYSSQKTEFFSPSFSVGNVKFDNWNDISQDDVHSFKEIHGLNNGKANLLYMPTWGELGSFNKIINQLGALKDKYNIILKMHHNNDYRLKNWKKTSESAGLSLNFEGDTDQLLLLKCTDVVISDFSGAIFDAVFADKPVVLYHEGVEDLVGVQKFNKNSLEYKHRHEIGYVCEDTKFLEEVIETAISNGVSEETNVLKKTLFAISSKKATEKIKDVLELHENGGILPLTEQQQWVREVTQNSRLMTRKYNRLSKKKASKK